MEKLTQKWCIPAFFDELEDGFEFAMTDYPLHMTIAGVFDFDKKGIEIAELINGLLAHSQSFEVVAGDDVYWGINKDIQVVLMEKSEQLASLVKKIYNFLISNGVEFYQPEYEGKYNISHSTVQKTDRLQKGETVIINKLSLVDMFPDSNGYRRRIVKTIYLK